MFIHDVQDRRGLKWNKDMEGDVIAIIDEMKNKIRSKVVHEVEKLLMNIMENDLNNREILSCSDYSKVLKVFTLIKFAADKEVNMSLMIVGADHLGNIEEKLIEMGFGEVIHITGRKVQDVNREIPEKINLILVLTDFVNHNLAKVIKQKAKEQSLPVYFAKRSWSSIYQVLRESKGLKSNRIYIN